MHDSSCHAASCGCQVRPTGVFAKGPKLRCNPSASTPNTHAYIKTPCASPEALSSSPNLYQPYALPSTPTPSVSTLIINDLRDSFHLIYYLGWDGGCCAAASLLDL